MAATSVQELPLIKDPETGAISHALARLKGAVELELYPRLAVRRDRLGRAIDVVIRSENRIVEALDADFGGRPEALSLLTDVMAPVRSLRYARSS